MNKGRFLIGLSLKLANQHHLGVGNRFVRFQNAPLVQSTIARYSSSNKSLPQVHFEDVRRCQKDKNIWIIDVREPNELVETGVIEGSINIPRCGILVGDVEQVLKNSSKDSFLKKYGRPKPDENSPIIFTCMRGRRSEKAQITAQQLGYKNVKNYIGGWTDWAEKIKSN